MAMKTLQLTKFYPPVRGGIETVSYELATGLMRAGVLTDVLCANMHPRTVRESGDAEEKIVRAASFGRLLSTSIAPALLIELLRTRSKYDIIHVQLPDPLACLALWLTRPKAKLLLHWQSDVVNQKRALKFFAPLQKWVLERADVISTSSSAYADHSPWLRPYLHKVKPLPLGISDPDPADPTEVEKMRSRYSGRPVIFSLGRMTYYKGFGNLIDAAEYLQSDAMIVVGGGGELLDEYRNAVKSRGLTNRICFVGPLSETEARAHFAGCDVFCLPSIVRAEAFGVVLVEAMAASRPIVATNIAGSGVPWVNLHDVSGLNVPVGDGVAMAKALDRLICDPELRSRLGRGARNRFETMFTSKRMVSNAVEIYTKMLREKI